MMDASFSGVRSGRLWRKYLLVRRLRGEGLLRKPFYDGRGVYNMNRGGGCIYIIKNETGWRYCLQCGGSLLYGGKLP